MRSLRDEPGDDRTLRDALAELAANPALRNDPAAAGALSTLASGLRLSQDKSKRLSRAARFVNPSLDRDSVLRNILDVAVDVMEAERGFLILADGREVAALHNVEVPITNTEASRPSRTILEHVFATGEPVFTTDAQLDPRWKSQYSVIAHHLRSIACVPLRLRADIIGTIYLDSRVIPGLFRPHDQQLLLTFAHHAALAIENAQLFAEERDRAARVSSMQAFQTRLLEAIANGVVTLDDRRVVTTFNRAAEKTFGVDAGAIVGKTATALDDLIPELGEMLDTFYASGSFHLRAEVEGIRADGTSVELEMRLSPLEDGGTTGVAVVLTDVTKHRQLEIAHAAEVERATLIEQSFSRYVAPHVVQSLMRDPTAIRLGGERRRATMLFADVRGFTSLAAELSAERVVELLNAYYDIAVKVIFAHDGLLDKFYGDGMMAVFGPPQSRDDDAQRAVEAAIALQKAVAAFAPTVDRPFAISVGLATGEVVAGHFGSTMRMDYTVIGDAVNLAAGLEAASPPGAIYLDAETVARAGTVSRPVAPICVRIKGRPEAVDAYTIQ